MFRNIAMMSFIAVIGGVLLHHLLYRCGSGPRFTPKALIRKKVHLFTTLFLEQQLGWFGRIRKLVLLVAILCFAVLFLTGFGPMLFGGSLHGYLLMIHATFAPVFIICVAVLALLGAGVYSYDKADADTIVGLFKKAPKIYDCWLTDSGLGTKSGFWVLIFLALPVTLSMVLSMLPIFGTDGQEFLFHLHRWAALAFAVVAICELYMLVRKEILKEFRD